MEIDLSRLNFSDNIDLNKLFPAPARQLLKQPQLNQQKLQVAFGKRLTVLPGSDQTIIVFHEPFIDVDASLPNYHPKFAAFGRVAFNVNTFTIIYHHRLHQYSFTGTLSSDFNPDKSGKRNPLAEGAVRGIHYLSPPSAKRYKIYGKVGTSSFFQRTRVVFPATPF